MQIDRDFVIVGGGSAGAALAARLSEDPAARVTLLEAGGPAKRRDIQVPAAWGRLLGTEVDWAFETEPAPACAGRRLYWPRGKVLGGSSAINAMIYTRGHRADFDGWRDLGSVGWGWADVAPAFNRLEDGPGVSGHPGVGGPVRLSLAQPLHPLASTFTEAARAAGIRENPALLGPDLEGCGAFVTTVDRGRRISASSAYLDPIRDRRNLEVRTGCLVTRVLLEGSRAVGVEYRQGGRKNAIRATAEVILSAGAIGSPHLLLLSGIGPADDLRAHGIGVVTDLPGVGANLQDHVLGPSAVHECRERITFDDAGTVGDLLRYFFRRDGRLRSNIVQAGAFVRLDPRAAAPDIELLIAPCFFVRHGFDNPPGRGFSIAAILQHPASRGRITLRSSDPGSPPRIECGYLEEESDLARLVQGLELARTVAAAEPFGRYRGAELFPGPRVETVAEIRRYLRRTVETIYHPVGTCRMGSDGEAVVDTELRVHGVDRLRVVDASVMPTITTGHTAGPTMMIAERAADRIRTRGTTGRTGA